MKLLLKVNFLVVDTYFSTQTNVLFICTKIPILISALYDNVTINIEYIVKSSITFINQILIAFLTVYHMQLAENYSSTCTDTRDLSQVCWPIFII